MSENYRSLTSSASSLHSTNLNSESENLSLLGAPRLTVMSLLEELAENVHDVNVDEGTVMNFWRALNVTAIDRHDRRARFRFETVAVDIVLIFTVVGLFGIQIVLFVCFCNDGARSVGNVGRARRSRQGLSTSVTPKGL